jgi:hypothetical protein
MRTASERTTRLAMKRSPGSWPQHLLLRTAFASGAVAAVQDNAPRGSVMAGAASTLIERQRDQSEREAIASARAPRRPNPSPPFIAVVHLRHQVPQPLGVRSHGCS